jgi:hypothetical protein
MNKLFKIRNTEYINSPSEYSSESTYPDFQEKLDFFKENLISNLNNKIPTSMSRFGDGDYYFLNQIPKGSAKPGKRALSKPYSDIDMEPFKQGYLKNDFNFCLVTSQHQNQFNEMFTRPMDFPSEIIYGLVANRWIFRNVNHKIGIIGAKPKVKIIKKLMQHDRYKDYLEKEAFNDYLYIDQNFACDNLSKTKKNLFKQVEKSESELFLVGVGHVKSGLLHELKKVKPAVYLDIGVGVDALAGLVNIYRPYFGKWKNHKISNNKLLYRKVDVLINNYGTLGRVTELP